MPERKVPRNHSTVTGRIASRKAVGDAEFEGPLERDLLTILEFDWTVERYEVQPVRIHYVDEEGKRRHYTPDVLIHYRQPEPGELARHPLLAEVKPEERLRGTWREVRRKVRAARAFSAERGWRFRVLTERHIRTPYLENARFLLSYTRQAPDPGKEELVLHLIEELGGATPEALLAAAYCHEMNRLMLIPSLWKLVGQGRISCDLRLPLTMSSWLWPAD